MHDRAAGPQRKRFLALALVSLLAAALAVELPHLRALWANRRLSSCLDQLERRMSQSQTLDLPQLQRDAYECVVRAGLQECVDPFDVRVRIGSSRRRIELHYIRDVRVFGVMRLLEFERPARPY